MFAFMVNENDPSLMFHVIHTGRQVLHGVDAEQVSLEASI